MIVYTINKSNIEKIYEHLMATNDNFSPPLDTRVNIKLFSEKISLKTVRFEAWDNNILIGLVSCYFNDRVNYLSYINNVSVITECMGLGISKKLLTMCLKYAKDQKFKVISLEVSPDNHRALEVYSKFGFYVYSEKQDYLLMRHILDI